MLEFKPTPKGVLRGAFKDRFGAECELQESSYTEESCIWVGPVIDSQGEPLTSSRMHLTRDQALELSLALRYFANEGWLGQYTTDHFRVGNWVRGIGRDNHEVYGRVQQAHIGDSITIQDQKVMGPTGEWVTLWSTITQEWEPAEPPPDGISLYDHLTEEED